MAGAELGKERGLLAGQTSVEPPHLAQRGGIGGTQRSPVGALPPLPLPCCHESALEGKLDRSWFGSVFEGTRERGRQLCRSVSDFVALDCHMTWDVTNGNVPAFVQNGLYGTHIRVIAADGR
jgi:hypothetical protein